MWGDSAPFRTIVVPPNNRLDGAAQVVVLRLVVWATLLDQRGQLGPLSIRQHAITSSICHGPDMAIVIRG
jgi:hypothetical protein